LQQQPGTGDAANQAEQDKPGQFGFVGGQLFTQGIGTAEVTGAGGEGVGGVGADGRDTNK